MKQPIHVAPNRRETARDVEPERDVLAGREAPDRHRRAPDEDRWTDFFETDVGAGRAHEIEVNLFVGPRASFDIGAQAFSAAGKSLALSLRGADQIVFALEDVKRAVALGIDSILVSDIGLLAVMSEMKQAGELPSDLIIKTSVMMAPANPASARVLEDLGATTINVPSDLTLPQLASIRAAILLYRRNRNSRWRRND